MESQRSVGAAAWPLMNVYLLLLLFGFTGAQSYEPAFIARPTKWMHKKPLLHKVSSSPPPHPWAGSSLSERVVSAGSLGGALFHAFVDPVLDKAPIVNTTAEAWTPLEFWGAGKFGSNNLSALPSVAVNDPLTQELAREVQIEKEHRRNPHLSQPPKVSVGLSHSSSSRVRASGSSQASSVDMQDSELELMSELLRNATNFFAFEGFLVPSAVQLNNLHHIHALEADEHTLNRLMVKPEVQKAIHQGKLVLTGQPEPTSCAPGQVKGAFEADWDLIFMGKGCSTDAVVKTLEATSNNAHVAVLGLGPLPEHSSVLDLCGKVRAAGALTVFVRNDMTSPNAETQSAKRSNSEETKMSLGDAVAPIVHGEGFWPR